MPSLPDSQHHAIGFRASVSNALYGMVWRLTVGGCIVVAFDRLLG